jgi:hypothetical protein
LPERRKIETISQPKGETMSKKKFDVWMDTGVCVTIPNDVDPTTSEGMMAIRSAAVEAFQKLVDSGDWIDYTIEKFAENADA